MNQDTSGGESVDKAAGRPVDTGADPNETHGRDRSGSGRGGHVQDTEGGPSVDKAAGRPTDTGADPDETHGRDRTGSAAHDRSGRGRSQDPTDGGHLGPAGDPVEGATDKVEDSRG